MGDVAMETEADSGSSATKHIATADGNLTPPHDSVTGSNVETFRCNKCDTFEASSQEALTLHKVSCGVTMSTETITEPKVETPPTDQRTHRKMFECDVCNMKFSNGANMRRHKMRHTGVKPYECRVCQKRFFRKDHLAEHFTTHTKTLPYHCPICNRGFQRQIAMRAHFQNEHVGQHDLVKSCPLCSYRAGSMKSLRVHFFNRHGIDLDNPGPAGQSQLLAAGLQALDGTLTSIGGLSVSVATYSDSGDSTGNRSADNATPPMHFLTPHVEISMSDTPASFSPVQCDQAQTVSDQSRLNGEYNGPSSPQSADSNSNNAPTSSIHTLNRDRDREGETSITPSISLIPIKQEPTSEDGSFESKNSSKNQNAVNLSTSPNSVQLSTATSSSLSSIIKVSPLKSLLREDLKRKIVVRGNRVRGGSPQNSENSPTDGTNGTITSTGPEQPSDSSIWRTAQKRSLSSLHCIFCGIGFPDQTLYFLHKGCHSDSNPWKCNICSEQCSNVYEFNSHLLSKSHQ